MAKKENIEVPEGLKSEAKKMADAHIKYGEKSGLMTKDEFWKRYHQICEENTKFAKKMRELGLENGFVQKMIVDAIKSEMGRTVRNPLFTNTFVGAPGTVEVRMHKDQKTKEEYLLVSAFGQSILKDKRTGKTTDPVLGKLIAFRDQAALIESIQEGKAFEFDVACPNIESPLVRLSLDERCKTEAKEVEKPNFDFIVDHLTNKWDVTKVSDARSSVSKNNNDLRLVIGRTESNPISQRNKGYKIEVTDPSVSLDAIEEKRGQANIAIIVNEHVAAQCGRGSLVAILGPISYNPPQKPGDVDYAPTMWWPTVIIISGEESPVKSASGNAGAEVKAEEGDDYYDLDDDDEDDESEDTKDDDDDDEDF